MSKEEASRTLVTRVFPVDGLIGGPVGNPSAEGMIKFIESSIEPESWKSGGGQGTINYYPGANCPHHPQLRFRHQRAGREVLPRSRSILPRQLGFADAH